MGRLGACGEAGWCRVMCQYQGKNVFRVSLYQGPVVDSAVGRLCAVDKGGWEAAMP